MASIAARLLVSVILLCGAFCAHAAQERYDYDGLGRLIRVIDEQGRVTEYVYDPAGNILQVIAGQGGAQGPAATAISPNTIRRGETKAVQITGTGFAGAQLGAADPGLDITNLRTSATQVLFDLSASASAALGPQAITLTNAAGTASATVIVNPAQPRLGMSPLPIAVPPNGVARSFFVSLSGADNIPHTITVASASPAIATVSPASITIAAGQTEAIVSIAGVAAGTTAINLTSATLPGTSVPVFVTAEFSGLTTSFAPPLGVTVQGAAAGGSTTFGPFVSALVGVTVGSYIADVAPRTLVIGTGPTPLVVTGAGLQGVTAVGIQPSDGLTLGAITVAPDGLTVSVPVTVAANAPTTVRKVTLSGAQQPYVPARADADQVLVALPAPQVFSIDPIVVTTGTTAATVTVRGRNLQSAQSVALTPAAGISIGTATVNATGTELTVAVSVAPLAAAGERVVTVTTPGGISSAAPSAANTLRVVSEVQGIVTPITAPLVGVVLGDAAAPVAATLSAYASAVGVAFGPAITARSPTAGIIGQTVQLTISGNELQGVSAVELSPNDGVATSVPVVSSDGRSVTVSLTIAASAPQTLRALRVRAGALDVAFSDPSAAQFRITGPLPSLDSVTPLVYTIGAAPLAITIRGTDLQGAQIVRAVPADGVSIASPLVNASGTELVATISVAPSAPLGARVIVVASAAGESANTTTAANTIRLVTATAGDVTPVVAPNVGVVFGEVAAPAAAPTGPIVSAALGVVLQDPNPPPPVQDTVRATLLGVAVGSFATGVQATPLSPNTSGTLTISGTGLADVTSVAIVPPADLTPGTLQIAPDGSQVTVPITVQPAAIPGLRGVQVFRGTAQVMFIPAGADTFSIGGGVPAIDSIAPILAGRGQTIALTIRGRNFQQLTAVTASPAAGLFIDSTPSVNAAGTEITLQIGVAADAPLGGRVIRVITPGGSSTADSLPANTFTVQP
jgi:YD repeat-containing protein